MAEGDKPTFGASFLQTVFATGHLIQPALVLMAVARLDSALEVALLAKMRSLSSHESKRLFKGRGPLSSLSSKMDLGYALSIFDEGVYSDLKVINKVRNESAHPTGPLKKLANFKSPPILTICQSFEGFDTAEHPGVFFGRRIARCILAISQDSEDRELARQFLSLPDRASLTPQIGDPDL
jgi:hypothetical protein